ncbi:hypothetical protein SAMN05421857_4042 [Chryseobacterium formosense]|nr:hypothetical protein [Chryseobacterium formosense]SFT90645.1 hypothetical protein SAMN05421857_4042 [Chryseobacterium formosense]
MNNDTITISVFNTKYSFWATIFTILFLLPSVILLIKYLNIRYTSNQTHLIILCLCLIFGFLIVVMKSTMQKVDIYKTDTNYFIKYHNGKTFLLSDQMVYNIYDYYSRKAFMLRISDEKLTKFLLSPDMSIKPEIEFFLRIV